MSILTVASGQSVYRGYEYAQAKKVLRMEQVGEGVIKANVSGSDDSTYDCVVDIAHPRKSHCNCSHAAGKRIVCKHIVAVYFTAFPAEAKKYIAELENYWESKSTADFYQGKKVLRLVSAQSLQNQLFGRIPGMSLTKRMYRWIWRELSLAPSAKLSRVHFWSG